MVFRAFQMQVKKGEHRDREETMPPVNSINHSQVTNRTGVIYDKVANQQNYISHFLANGFNCR